MDEAFKQITITATAPSKTFNLAGLQQSNIFIPNEDIRNRFVTQYEISGLDEPNIFGIAASQAAYSKGDEWYLAMKNYVWENIKFADDFVNNELKGVTMNKPEGTYLIWLDFNKTGLDVNEIDNLIINKAKLWLDSGKIFGKAGEGFQRINVTCPRIVLEEALDRIKKAF